MIEVKYKTDIVHDPETFEAKVGLKVSFNISKLEELSDEALKEELFQNVR